MTPFVYELASPIDFWDGFALLEDFTCSDALDDEIAYRAERPPTRAMKLLAASMHIASTRGHWEGDIRGGPFISGLPRDGYPNALIVAWKQDNNGTTFVGSEIELPWLSEGQIR
jgi:hypothetical protein